MELALNISPDQINQLVATAVLESAIGTQVKERVAKAVAEFGKSYDNPIDGIVRNEVTNIVRDLLLGEYRASIEEQIRLHLTGALTSDFIMKIVTSGLSRY